MPAMDSELVFVPLGGLGEIGMNAALYGIGPKRGRKWILVDCGMGFGGEEHLPGIDLVYPDLGFIEQAREDLLGIFITHAHEDHIGALVEMWPRLGAPVFATRFAIGRFDARIGPSRWRDTDAIQLHYDPSRLPGPIKGRLYDEIKPLSGDLVLGLGGVNAERGEGDHFWFVLTR